MEKLYQELLMDINNNLYINKIKKNINSCIQYLFDVWEWASILL